MASRSATVSLWGVSKRSLELSERRLMEWAVKYANTAAILMISLVELSWSFMGLKCIIVGFQWMAR